MGNDSRIYGEDGSRPVSEPDQTSGKLIPFLFRNMHYEAIANTQEAMGISEGFRYDPKHGSRQACSFEKGSGIKQDE